MEWQPIDVIEIATGNLISIKDIRFNPELHKLPKVEVPEEPKKPVKKATKKQKDDK